MKNRLRVEIFYFFFYFEIVVQFNHVPWLSMSFFCVFEIKKNQISLIVLVQWYLCAILDDFYAGHLRIATLGFQDHQVSPLYDKCAKNLVTGCSVNSATHETWAASSA